MKNNKLAIGLIALLTLPALAEDDALPYKNWVGGFAEYYNADSDKPDPTGYLDDGYGFGFEIGHRFDPHWALRFEWSNLDLDKEDVVLVDQKFNNTGYRAGFDAMYFARDDLFYIFGGLKQASYGESHRLANLGLGKHWQLNDKWRFISEATMYHDLGESFRDWGLKFGVAYTFGGTPKASGPKDSDGDGVFDHMDECPNTPPGTAVDAKGCNRDSDGDGVPNSMDKCPGTPAGTRVDADGCNWDKDGDGVANEIDMCPDTPPGTKVGAKGCALDIDSDQDGVLDTIDQCPDTPLTDKVDEVGCSIFLEKEVTVSLRVLFDNNSADINNPDDEQFQAFGDFMARFPNTRAVIEGHTSAVGADDYNKMLSEKRAKAVRELLVSQYGISGDRLTAVGYGETRLLDDSGSAEAARINRRIEARVTAMEKVKAQRD